MSGELYYKEYVRGNDNAFESVVRIYYDGLVAFINRYTKSLTDAEDVANDCFLYIAIHKNRYDSRKTSLKTYLYTIGRSKALNFIKKRERKKTYNLDDYQDLPSQIESADDRVEKIERNQILYEAIALLPDEMQTVIYLFYFESMSYEEISKITSKKIKQIDNILYRAKKQLKGILKKEDK